MWSAIMLSNTFPHVFWVSYNLVCSVCGGLVLLFLCIIVGSGLLAYFRI